MKHPIHFLALLALAASTAAQSTLIVDPAGPYTTIQSAIDAASSGDTVLVSPGTYLERIDFLGKDVAVVAAGPGGPAAHVIDAQGDPAACGFGSPTCGTGPVVTFASGEGPAALLEGFTVTGGVGLGGAGEDPGGVLVSGASPTIRDCHIVGNHGSRPFTGPVLFVFHGPGGPGGMAVRSGAPTLQSCEFRDNVGRDGEVGLSSEGDFDFAGGAGGLLIDGGSVDLVDCTFRGNVGGKGQGQSCTTNPFGGGTSCGPSTSRNAGAGAVWLRGGSLVAQGCSFTENVHQGEDDLFAPTGSGAVRVGQALSTSSILGGAVLVDCDLSRNVDGALYLSNTGAAEVHLVGCRVVANTGRTIRSVYEESAGNYNATLQLDDCLLIGNHGGPLTDGLYDAAYVPSGGPIRMEGCVITDHHATGGWAVFSGDVSVANSIAWNNAPPGAPAEFSCVQGGAPGAGNISADPQFVQAPAPGPDGVWGTDDDDLGDLRLAPGSPCIDAGSNLLAVTGSTDADLDGNLRFHDDPATADTGIAGGLGAGAVIDMGAYEHGSTPTPWTDLGQGQGTVTWVAPTWPWTKDGVASLAGYGGLAAGEITFLLVQTPVAAAGRLCVIAAGPSELGLPLLGQTLVPDPQVLVTLFTDAQGAALLEFPWPAGASSGFPFFYQAWVDTSGAGTFTSSDALRSVAP